MKTDKKVIGYNHPEAVANRAIVQAETNSHKLNIDYACFAKTPEEKAELKLAVKAYKKSQR